MAAVTSAWTKPGAWALDAEEQEEADLKNAGDVKSPANPTEFPSLAAASKAPKKKKAQKISLAELNTGHPVTHGSAARFQPSVKGFTQDEFLNLPTGPRERTPEELERGPRGFRYSYGSDRGPREDSSSRWGSSRVSDEGRRSEKVDLGPSRADEVDDWGAGKKTVVGPPEKRGGAFFDSGPSRADEIDDWGAGKKAVVPERREREKSVGFFDSQSRADDSHNWVSNKPVLAPMEGRVSNGFNKEGSFGSGVDSDLWGKRREEPRTGGRTDMEPWGKNKRDEVIGGSRSDSDSWGKKRDETSNGGRPRLVLQPRSLPVTDGSNGDTTGERSRGLNPFGAARPREEVLAEKGEDWKKIDEKLESARIRVATPEKKGFSVGYGAGGSSDDRVGKSWRKTTNGDATSQLPPESIDKTEEPVQES